jgi:hypothetical protein
MFVKHVSLKPHFGVECGSDTKLAAQGSSIDQHFEFDSFTIEVNPEQFASGEWVLQRLKSDDAA